MAIYDNYTTPIAIHDVFVWSHGRLGCERDLRDKRNDTRKSMPETNRMAGPIRFVEHELATFEGNRLGLIKDFDKKPGHHSGCWLWGWSNRE